MNHKTLAGALVVGIVISLTTFNAPTHAVCTLQYPTIGTIASTTTERGWTTLHLENKHVFDASAIGSATTSINAYNDLATGFAKSYRVPTSYVSTDDTAQNTAYAFVGVSAAASSHVSYHTGDIVVMGPPGGGSCNQDGFVGFFGSDGTIQTAIASDSFYVGYTYGGDSLALTPGKDYACKKESTFGASTSVCSVPITYSLKGGSSMSLMPGQSKTIAGTHTYTITLTESTHTIVSQNQGIEDFYPRSLEHIIDFTESAPLPIPASCPVITRNLTRGSHGADVTALQTFLISTGDLNATATGYFGALTEKALQAWQAAEGIVASGTPWSTGYGAVGPKTRAALRTCHVGPITY